MSVLDLGALYPDPPYLPPNAIEGAKRSSDGSQPNSQWSTLLGNLLFFYEAQRSGILPPSKRVSWRNSSTVNDGQDVNLDLSGGYFDAGDYIKATFPLSATLMSICWGATDYGRAYDFTNQTVYLDDMLRWGLDWLMKAHPANNTLYVLVDSTGLDDSYWGGDENIPSPRPSYQINSTHPGTDAAAGASDAFASCSSLYMNKSFGKPFSSPASLQNSSYGEKLLEHAIQLYSFATNATGGLLTYQTSVPAITASYGSSSYGDELTLAALFLAWATNSGSLFRDAESFYQKYSLREQDGIFNWDSKTPSLAVLVSQVIRSSPGLGGTLATWQKEAERYFDHIYSMEQPGYLTKNGLLYYDGDSDSASLNPALNAAMLMARYAEIASTPEKTASYMVDTHCKRSDYAMGKNPMHVPYIVCSHPNSPANPHSAMASGGGNIGTIDTSPAEEAYLIYGAVIGGPDKHDKHYDIRSDWPQTEASVALDYNAPMLTLAAMHVLSDSNDPFFTSLEVGAHERVRPKGHPCDLAFEDACRGPQLSKGGKTAIAVVVTIVGLMIFGLLAQVEETKAPSFDTNGHYCCWTVDFHWDLWAM